MGDFVAEGVCPTCKKVVDIVRRGRRLAVAPHKSTSLGNGWRQQKRACRVAGLDATAAIQLWLVRLREAVERHAHEADLKRQLLAVAEARVAAARETYQNEVSKVNEVFAELGMPAIPVAPLTPLAPKESP